MEQPVVHFEIGGPDRVALQQFYGRLFGWEVDDMPAANYGMVKTGGEGGIGGGISGRSDGLSRVQLGHVLCACG